VIRGLRFEDERLTQRALLEGIAMQAKELRNKDAKGLAEELRQLLKARFSARMQKATQQLQNHTQLRKLRRDIARVHTVMAEKAAKR
jgi:large subunit ribosomal protein L29